MTYLEELFKSGKFIALAEIAAKVDESVDQIIERFRDLEKIVDVVVFSDQAGGRSEFLTIESLAEMGVFSKLPRGKFFPVLVTRRRSVEEFRKITKVLNEQNVETVFVVSGDVKEGNFDSKIYSTDVIQDLKKDFLVGAVMQFGENERNLKKVNLGAKFLISQVAFSDVSWQKFSVPVIPAIIPVLSNKTLDILQNHLRLPFSEEMKKRFSGLTDEQVRQVGIKVALEQVREYKKMGIFSGVYVYSRSVEVVSEVLAVS